MAGDLGLFGGPIGQIRYNEDQLTKAQTAKTLAETASMPTTQRLHAAQAETLELQLLEERRMAAMLAGQASGAPAAGVTRPDGTPKPLSNIYDDLARMAMGAGAPTKATEFAKAAGTLRAQESLVLSREAATELAGLRAQKERIDLTSRLLDNVKDDASWNQAQLLYQAMTGEKSIFAGLPYSKELVERIRTSGMTTKEQVAAREKALEDASKDRSRKGLAAHREAIEKLNRERLDLEKRREDRLSKAGGGKGVTSPTKVEVDQALRLVKQDYKELDGSDLLTAATAIASEARVLRRANPALDMSTAVNQAYIKARNRGDFKEVVEKGFFGDKKHTQFQGKGQAIPAPEVGQRVYGRFYSNPKGQVAKWTKEGWEPVAGTADEEGEEDDGEGEE